MAVEHRKKPLPNAGFKVFDRGDFGREAIVKKVMGTGLQVIVQPSYRPTKPVDLETGRHHSEWAKVRPIYEF